MAQSLVDLLLEFAKQVRYAITQAEQAKQKQQEKGTWQGYDADGNGLVKINGQTKSKTVIGNIGLPVNSEIVIDNIQTAETSEKPRDKKNLSEGNGLSRGRTTKKSQGIVQVTESKKKKDAPVILEDLQDDGLIATVCIAVIDETSSAPAATLTANWTTFRTLYPSRPFFLLIPNTTTANVFVPAAMQADELVTIQQVIRDEGTAASSDWFNICRLGGDYSGANIILFIDISGSMDISTVQTSYNNFKSRCDAAGNVVRSVTNANENYIAPFAVPDPDFSDGISVWPQ